MEAQSLKEKTVKGTFWSAADAFLGQGITFIVGLVLARLLTPEEYGLLGICLIFITVLNGIVDSGFSNALIRKSDVTSEDYNTMFVTNLVVSVILYSLLYCLSPFIASFFGRFELVEVLRVTGVILIIQALSITQITILTKKIDFKTKTKASLVSAVLSGVIGIIMALRGYGVWSLVGQQLSKQTLYTICLWALNKWWPNFNFDINSFKYMWGFGWKMMVSGLLNNIWNQLYQVVVGKFYSPATLGQYTRANEYASIFSTNLTTIVQRVTYPVLSELQGDKQRMIDAYRKVIKMTMYVTAICMFALASYSEPIIYCLIGEKWHDAATYLPFICVSMSLFPLHAINLNMLQVQGRSDVFLYLEIIKKIISIIPICLGIFVSIYWMLVGSIIAGVLAFFLNSYYTGKELNYSSWSQLRDISPSYLVALIVFCGSYPLKYLPLNNWMILALQFMTSSLIVIICSKILKLKEYEEVKQIAKGMIKKVNINKHILKQDDK